MEAWKRIFEGVEVHFNPATGVVSWMSEWEKADELEKKGYLNHKFYRHLYGHTETLINEKYR